MVYFGECCTDCSLRPMFIFVQAGVLCKWTNDSHRFLLEYFDIIHNSPSHIYHSALPFSPSSSWLQKCYSEEILPMVKVVRGLPAEWGMCSRTVSLDYLPQALSYWKNTIAVGIDHRDIIIFNTITGSQTAVLSGHTDKVNSLVFSSDGASLVSGSRDSTVKLWDVQTGGVIKTFSGNTGHIWSVSISADYTRIASGSSDNTIHLWDIQTGGCNHVIKQQYNIYHVCFSSTDPQYLLSCSGDKIWQWDTHGQQTPPAYDGFQVSFSPNGTQFVLCNKKVVTVQNSDSRAIVAEFHVPNGSAHCCCFSPDGRLVAVSAGSTAYIWDITNSDPHLVETFIGHAATITSLAFSSPFSLISASKDKSIKLWQIGTLPTDPVKTDPKPTPLTLVPIKFITLQTKDGVAISSDLGIMTRVWDISTGICKASFQNPNTVSWYRDAQLVDGRLIFVWHAVEKIHIWDPEKMELLQTVDAPRQGLEDLKISGDGSKIFCLYYTHIQAWSMQTGEAVGRVEINYVDLQQSLTVYDTRVWIHYPGSEYQGWDFGTQGSSPVQLSNMPPDRFHLTDTMLWDTELLRIKDTVTGKVIFQLPERFTNPTTVQFDCCYFAAGYSSGEVLILDFNHVFFQ